MKNNPLPAYFLWLPVVMAFLLNPLHTEAQAVIKINEIQAANYSTLADADFRNFSDWLELYNTSSSPVDLGGFYLTDDPELPQKWVFPAGITIPANGFLMIWCDDRDVMQSEIHTNFKLSAGGETVALFDPGLTLIDSVTFASMPDDIAYGCFPEGSSERAYFELPTPGTTNIGPAYPDHTQSPDVEFSLSSGFFGSAQSLSLSCPGTGYEIRYTLDGSIPGNNSTLYQSPLIIDSNQVVTARSFTTGVLPGSVHSQSYFIDNPANLPVVSMIINPGFLWDPETGIYVDENIENRAGWERKCTLEYFDGNQQHAFTTGADIRLFGNTAFYYPQKSLSVFPDHPVDYPLFPQKETGALESFLLRSSSDDWPYTMMRDALMQSLFGDILNLDFQAYTPSILYINGRYWGIHNIREKINEAFIQAYHGVEPSNLDLVSMDLRDTTFTCLAGDLTDLNELIGFIHTHDLSQEVNYNWVAQRIDLENYADYLITHIVYSNTSWHHNVKLWKPRDQGSRWQWFAYDLDRGMTPYYLDLFSVIRDMDTTDLFFPHLNENEAFRALFLNRFNMYMNSAFSKERVLHFIDSLQNRIAAEIPGHSLRWRNECDPWGQCGIQSFEDWQADLDVLRSYAQTAPQQVTAYVNDFYGLSGTRTITLDITHPDKGRVFINGLEYTTPGEPWVFNGNSTLEIVADPDLGQLFLGFTHLTFNDTLILNLTQDTLIEAYFGSYCILPVNITESITLGGSCDAYFTQGNIVVEPGVTLTIPEGIHILFSEADTLFVHGNLEVNGTYGREVYFRAADDAGPWGCISGTGAGLNIHFAGFLDGRSAIRLDGGELMLDHCKVFYTPHFYSDIVAVHHAAVTLTDNLFYGPTGQGKSDVIDCDEVPYAYISGNYIYGATDDGIDIGTGSQDITIRNNFISGAQSMGISVGEYTHATVERNIMANCDIAGLQVHTGAVVLCDHNTLYGNHVGIRCYHYDNEPQSGGTATISNCIISQSDSLDFTTLENPAPEIRYSLSDTGTLPGIGNLEADPLFVSPGEYDFSLLGDSPCINSGDPLANPDPDGTQTDIGAVYHDQSTILSGMFERPELLLFPNPAVKRFSILLTSSDEFIASVSVLNQLGLEVFSKTTGGNPNCLSIDDFIETGIFIVRIITRHGNIYTAPLVTLHPEKK